MAAVALLAACDAYKEDRLPPREVAGMGGGTGGHAGGDGGAPADGGLDEDGGGGTGDGGPMCTAGTEACNLRDDDCDGAVDEAKATKIACEKIVLNADTDCVHSGGRAFCLKIECLPGWKDLDGLPSNGCEAVDDSDGGADMDGGS